MLNNVVGGGGGGGGGAAAVAPVTVNAGDKRVWLPNFA
jgi:hypothetical protein